MKNLVLLSFLFIINYSLTCQVKLIPFTNSTYDSLAVFEQNHDTGARAKELEAEYKSNLVETRREDSILRSSTKTGEEVKSQEQKTVYNHSIIDRIMTEEEKNELRSEKMHPSMMCQGKILKIGRLTDGPYYFNDGSYNSYCGIELIDGNDKYECYFSSVYKKRLEVFNSGDIIKIKGEFLCAFGYDVVLTKCVILK